MSKEDLIVLVGFGSGHPDRIVEALNHHGYRTLPVRHMWPRDEFVCTGPKRYAVSKFGLYTASEGGYYLPGTSFILAPDCLAGIVKLLHEQNSSFEDATTTVSRHLTDLFSNLRGHVFPSGYYHDQKMEDHLDLYATVFPNAQLLIVDTYNKRKAQQGTIYTLTEARERIESIAEAEKLELLWYDSSREAAWYPMNILVLPADDTHDFAIIDEKAEGLVRILRERAIPFATVPTTDYERPCGKIHCATNHVYVKDAERYSSPREFLAHLQITHVEQSDEELMRLFKT